MECATGATRRKRVGLLFFVSLGVVFDLSLRAQPDRLRPLEELLNPDKLEDYRREDYHDRLEILRKAIEQNAKGLEVEGDNAQLPELKARIENIQSLCRYALRDSHQEGDPKELSDREVKKLEIVARRLTFRLEDLKRSLPFPEQALLDSVIRTLQQLREQLLKQLFGVDVSDNK